MQLGKPINHIIDSSIRKYVSEQLGKPIDHIIDSSIRKYVSDPIVNVIYNSSFNSSLRDSASVEIVGIIWDSIRISMYKSTSDSVFKLTSDKI